MTGPTGFAAQAHVDVAVIPYLVVHVIPHRAP